MKTSNLTTVTILKQITKRVKMNSKAMYEDNMKINCGTGKNPLSRYGNFFCQQLEIQRESINPPSQHSNPY
jgi:hypothetical protein